MLLHTYYYVRPGGGPAGYLWNLKSSLNTYNTNMIIPINIVPLYSNHTEYPRVNFSYVRQFATIKSLRLFMAIYGALRRRTRKLPRQFSFHREAEVLVLHSTDFAYRFIRTYGKADKCGQRLFVMPHAPTDETEEAILSWAAIFGEDPTQSYLHWLRRLMAEAELSVFEHVEGIIVPCVESLEAYFVYDPVLRNRFERRLRQLTIFEIPTGVVPLPLSNLDRYNARIKLGLPQEKIVIAYLGRYHKHKGFPLFRELVEYADSKEDNFYFVSAGKGNERVPKAKKYKNLGWVNREQLSDLMVAVDVVLYPNSVAYFDLALLESMSVGKVLFVRNVGGHRKINAPGVLKIDSGNPEEWYWELRKFIDKKFRDLPDLGAANKHIFETEYSQKVFLERHIQLTMELLGK